MRIKVGTFNLNNLFSKFNFSAAIQDLDIHVMKSFNKKYLDNLYPHQVLIEGNDPRFIDVALFSKLSLGAVATFQTAVHQDAPQQRVFGRDLLEVEILNEAQTRKLFTLYNNHLKSHFGDGSGHDPAWVELDI